MIKFGTSGWRAIIGDEFTFANVNLVTQAIADYIKDTGLAHRGVIVGYDTRFLSKEFAQSSCAVLSGNGIKSLLADRDVPTPVISFHILRKRAAGAINFTASHNPPEYNGMKFSNSHGGPVAPEVTQEIEKRIARVSGTRAFQTRIGINFQCGFGKTFGKTRTAIKTFDPRPAYLSHVKSMVELGAIRKARLSVVVDCMYGTGRGYLDELLAGTGCKVKVLHKTPDPNFGGMAPAPSEKNLAELIREVRKEKADLGLATDGDGDRFGIIDEKGRYLSANEIIGLLLEHLISTRKRRRKVARTAATTHMVDRIAAREGLEVVETPVGFKYIGLELSGGDCILGGEESGGISIAGHLPEKDGILACLLAAEMVAVHKKGLGKLLEELYKKYGRLYNKRIDISLVGKKKSTIVDGINRALSKKRAGLEIKSTSRKFGYEYTFADGSWMLFRFSGTEPAARCYIESSSLSKLKELEKAATKIVDIRG